VRYGDRRDLEDMPSSQTTKPAVLVRPHTEKRQLVPYNAEKALELLMRRDPLPPVYASPAEEIEILEGMIGRGELVIKHGSAEDLMRRTRNDEG
jgi:anaerobic dimethyl sulfoxide reductase subunit B (iron-sulfur subunit)